MFTDRHSTFPLLGTGEKKQRKIPSKDKGMDRIYGRDLDGIHCPENDVGICLHSKTCKKII